MGYESFLIGEVDMSERVLRVKREVLRKIVSACRRYYGNLCVILDIKEDLIENVDFAVGCAPASGIYFFIDHCPHYFISHEDIVMRLKELFVLNDIYSDVKVVD